MNSRRVLASLVVLTVAGCAGDDGAAADSGLITGIGTSTPGASTGPAPESTTGGADATAATSSHDAFSGVVYASLRNLDVLAIRPFTAEVENSNVMPAIGRIAVSPDGQLWYAPLGFILPGQPIFAWDIPDSL